MLGMTEYTQEFMQLELELGKVYKGRGDYELARENFVIMVEKYSFKGLKMIPHQYEIDQYGNMIYIRKLIDGNMEKQNYGVEIAKKLGLTL